MGGLCRARPRLLVSVRYQDRPTVMVHPVTLALAIVAPDLVAVTIAFLVDAKRPEMILLVPNVFVLLVLYFVHASGGITFMYDD